MGFKRFGITAGREIEADHSRPENSADEKYRKMLENMAKASLAEAILELAIVTSELLSLGGEDLEWIPQEPNTWSQRHWLQARKIALQARVQRG